MGAVVGRVVELEAVREKFAVQRVVGREGIKKPLVEGFIDVDVAHGIAQGGQRGGFGGAQHQVLEAAQRGGHQGQRIGGGLGQEGLERRAAEANVARKHVHELREGGLHGLGFKIEVGTAQAGGFGLPLAQQLAHHQQVELAHGREPEHGRAIERGIGLGAKVLVAEPGGQAAAILGALGEAIFVVHKKAGFGGRS